MTRIALTTTLAVLLHGCSLNPVVPVDEPVPGTSLRDDLAETIESEKRRVDDFPDLPDAAESRLPDDEVGEADEAPAPGAVSERAREERKDAYNRYTLTAHKQNFVLPVAYTNGLNEEVYRENGEPLRDGLQPVEVKFQISLKTQLNESDLFLKDDAVSLGLTLEAWWQLYSSDLSSPFRETNYQPEIFYTKPLLWGPFGGSTTWLLGLEHQSNGQVQGLSRSWNRLYTGLIYERGDFVARIRPWYRLPEKSKPSPDSPEGDDNPDILDFMGHGDLSLFLRRGTDEYGMMVRGNTGTGKGALSLRWSFPLFGKFRGLVEYFNGYGDSLIDYDFHQQRLGLGVALTPLL